MYCSKSSEELWDKYRKRVKIEDSVFKDSFLELVKKNLSTTTTTKDVEDQFGRLICDDGNPLPALCAILELKKSSHLGQNEMGMKLVKIWMKGNCCSEALLQLAVNSNGSTDAGDDVQVQEIANFQRVIFLIPDEFKLSNEDFIEFILHQVCLTISTITYGIREQNDLQVNSKPIASFLEKIFLRFHSTSGDLEELLQNCQIQRQKSQRKNPWTLFLSRLVEICRNDFIARRVVAKVLLNLTSSTATKLSKTLFILDIKSAASTLLQPTIEFLDKNSIWKHTLLYSIPFKTTTLSTKFWNNWAFYIYSNSPTNQCKLDIWENTVKNWSSLCSNIYFDSNPMMSASLALVSIAKQIRISETKQIHFDSTQEITRIFENVSKCLESLSEEKRACGMALGQIIADLNFSIMSKDQSSEAEHKDKLKFDCDHKSFQDLIQFYNSDNNIDDVDEDEDDIDEDDIEIEKTSVEKDQEPIPMSTMLDINAKESINKITDKILDSDDEIDDLEAYDMSNDTPLNEEIAGDHKTKLPSLFSEIHEVLIEKTNKADEVNFSLIKYTIMKIPLLLSSGVKIDETMAKSLARILCDFEDTTYPEFIIIIALMELAKSHTFIVFDTLASSSFDNQHLTIGHRITVMMRIRKIAELFSQQQCLNCYKDDVPQDLEELSPQFIKYVSVRQKLQRCKTCSAVQDKLDVHNLLKDEEEQHNLAKKVDLKNKALTWREIVDQRIQAKTRYFFNSSKNKNKSSNNNYPIKGGELLLGQQYGTHYIPIIWATLSNRLINQSDKLLEENIGISETFLVHILQLLGRCLLGTTSSTCPQFVNISKQVGEITEIYLYHKEVRVRRMVLSLVAITLTSGEGKSFIIEAISSQSNILETIQKLRNFEIDQENKKLTDQILSYIQRAAIIGLNIENLA